MSTWVTIAILGVILHLAVMALNCAFGLYTLFAEPRATPANAKERMLVALFGLQGTLVLALAQWAYRSNWRVAVSVVLFLGVVMGPIAAIPTISERYGSEAGLAATVVWATLAVSVLSGILVEMRRKRLTEER